LTAFSIQYVGAAGTATMSIDYSSHLLTTTVGGVEDLNIDLSNSSYDTIPELTTYINGLADYTVASVKCNTCSLPCTSLEDVTDQDIVISFDVQMDTTIDSTPATSRFWDDEMIGSKSDIENNIPGYTCKSFNYPGGITINKNAIKAALLAAGYEGAMVSGDDERDLSDIEIFGTPIYNLSSFRGTIDIEKKVSAWIETARQFGFVICFYGHSTGEYSLANWKSVIDAIYLSGATSVGYDDVYDWIIGNSSTADGGATWTRTFTDNSDYTLQATSPCINAGTDPFSDGDGDQYDMAGELVWSDTTDLPANNWADGVEIGAYGYEEMPAAITGGVRFRGVSLTSAP